MADVAAPSGGAATALRGAAITMAGRGIQLALQLVALVVLARYLNPTDYGLVAMASAVVGIAGLLGDFGISLSALRSPDLTRVERDTLLWLSGGFGLVLALAFSALAPTIASFYDQPAVAMIIWSLTPLFVVNGVVGQYRVDATRRQKYRATAVADVIGGAAGLASAVAVAVAGGGYWALVTQSWVGSVLCLALLVVTCGWFPGLPSLRRGRVKHHLGFGAFSSGTQIANYVSAQVDSVALGRFLGPAVVGLYNRSYQLFALPVVQLTAPLTAIMLPLLARVGADELPGALIRAQRFLTYVILGVSLVIAAGGDPLVALLLGPGWGGAGVLLQLLMIGAIFQVSGYVYYWAFLVTGRTSLLFWTEVPPRLVMTGLIAMAATQGPQAAALAHSAGLFLAWLVPAFSGVRRLGWRPWEFIGGCVRPVALYLTVFALAVLAREGALRAGWTDPAVVAVTMAVVVMGVGSALVLPRFRGDLSEILKLVATMRRR